MQVLSLSKWRHEIVEAGSSSSEAEARVNVNAIDRLVTSSLDKDAAAATISEKLARPRRCTDGRWCDEERDPAVIHLEGRKIASAREVATDLKAASRGETTVKDWTVGLNQSSSFSFSDGKVRVEEKGVYFLYSQFYFRTNGSRCTYRLRYGSGFDEFNTCIQELNVSADSAHSSKAKGKTTPQTYIAKTQWRPCFLGFPRVLQRGDVVELDLIDMYQLCRFEEQDFKKAMMHSYWGLVRLGPLDPSRN